MSASATAPAGDTGATKPKRRGKLLLIVIGIAVLALAGAVAALLLIKQHQAEDEYDDLDEPAQVERKADPKHPPIYLPLDSMVVNLADPGGSRFAQLGITLKLQDEATATAIKSRMPSIRNGILLQISQRTANELLSLEGKQRLNRDIIHEISTEMGYGPDKAAAGDDPYRQGKPRARKQPNPVQDVLFSSFLVQ